MSWGMTTSSVTLSVVMWPSSWRPLLDKWLWCSQRRSALNMSQSPDHLQLRYILNTSCAWHSMKGGTKCSNTSDMSLQDSTSASEIQDFFKKNVLPLVGHRKQSNDAKRYTKRPLVVVYYGVDFSFDYRVGKWVMVTPVFIFTVGMKYL